MHRRRFTLAVCLALLLLPLLSPGLSLAANGPGGPRSTGSAPTPSTTGSTGANGDGTGLDLAAMGAQPADLVAVGLKGVDNSNPYPGFALSNSGAEITLDPADLSLKWSDKVVKQVIADGFKQDVALDLTSGSSSGGLLYFTTDMTEFTAASGAHTRFTQITGNIDANITETSSGTSTPVAIKTVGDESALYRTVGADGSFSEMNLFFRTGAVVVDLQLHSATTSFTGVDLDQLPTQLRSIAKTVLDRIKKGNQAAPGLANHLVALRERADLLPSQVNAQYLRISGVTIPFYKESPDLLAKRDVEATKKGVKDDLYVFQSIYDRATASQDAANLELTLVNHDTVAHAANQVATVLDGFKEANPNATLKTDSSYHIGDDSVAFTVTARTSDGSTQTVAEVDFHIGALYASIDFYTGAGAVDQAAAEEVATKEAACLGGTGPCGMIDVPAGVVPNNGPAATTPEATATSAPEASPSASASDSGVNGRHYQSARYKFSFSWGKDWSVSDDQSSATSDTLTLAHGDALLFSDVFPYDGTAKDCVNASIDQYQSGTVFSNVTPASETNGAPASGSVVHGGAFADVSADTTDANGKAESVGIEIVCWVVDPDAKVVARFEFVAPADQFEAEVKAFKKVVQTVKI